MFGKSCQTKAPGRRGAVTVMVVMFLFIFITLAAMAIDLGYLAMARAQMQRTADSAALAAIWEYAVRVQAGGNAVDARDHGFEHALSVTAENRIANAVPLLATQDVVWGHLADFHNRNELLNPCLPAEMTNAVEVTVRRTESLNGRIPSFFARIMGVPGFSSTTTATAGMVRGVRGFRAPSDGSSLQILPLTLDEASWGDLLNGGGADNWSFDPVTKTVSPGSDGIREVNLYPTDSGPSEFRGTLEIGAYAEGLSEAGRQIEEGISSDDLSHHGGALVLNGGGTLSLYGASGISAILGDSLTAVQGQPRVIPIFRTALDTGGCAQYTIVRFGGVRIVEVSLEGEEGERRVIVQPAPVVSKGLIPSDDFSPTSDFVYSSAILLR